MSRDRVYLDWNATAPLRPEARAAMIAAMDVVGNPTSVHAEGRAAKAIVDKARGQVAALVGCDRDEVVFTSGATEALQLVLSQPWDALACSPLEHDAVAGSTPILETFARETEPTVDRRGVFLIETSRRGVGLDRFSAEARRETRPHHETALFALTAANSETGVIQPVAAAAALLRGEFARTYLMTDATQAFGKSKASFPSFSAEFAALSGHKLGAPKGVGALVLKAGVAIAAPLRGGGQEQGRRSGTENVVGIAGFGAAAEAALRDVEAGVWEPIAALRDRLEDRLREAAPELIVLGAGAPRLPNTSCIAVPGWKGETQVIQMDLAGFAISAGSACSSGKVTASRVLMAMGFDEATAGSAIRVSMGSTTTEAEVMAFADAWAAAYRRWASKRRS